MFKELEGTRSTVYEQIENIEKEKGWKNHILEAKIQITNKELAGGLRRHVRMGGSIWAWGQVHRNEPVRGAERKKGDGKVNGPHGPCGAPPSMATCPRWEPQEQRWPKRGREECLKTPPKSGERHDSVPPRSSADAKDRGLIKLSKDKEPRRREGSSWPHTGDPDKVT